MAWQMQVLLKTVDGDEKWFPVRPSGKPKPEPYRFDTQEEAERTLQRCYGGIVRPERMRVVEIEDESV